MYQLHFQRGDADAFRAFVGNVVDRASASTTSNVLFHLFNDTAQRDVTDKAAEIIREIMPNAVFAGCSTSGNICDGALVQGGLPNFTAVANVFEDPQTRVEVHQFPLNRENYADTSQQIQKLVSERPWVKAIEMLTTLIDVGMADFCAEARLLRDDIVIFGGGALSSESIDMWGGLPYVLSSDGESSNGSIVIVMYGGENFHVQTQTIYGWKPLGRYMTITRAEGAILYELDGSPAFQRYHHYLTLEDDDRFSANSIIFPLAIDHDGKTVIKAPAMVDDKGAITLTSDLAPYHKECRIAYGDPGTILRSIRDNSALIRDFKPQGIFAYSCAARRMYWGDENISRETLPLQGVAPVAGFYTGGEFARTDGELLHHNVTLVVAGIREGDVSEMPTGEVRINETEFTRQMSIVNSLAAFVGVTSAELEEAYAKLEIVAKTDGLTGVFNRREIEERIGDALSDFEIGAAAVPPSIVMLDIDDFKVVNDAYGHKAGDDVLRNLGTLLRMLADDAGIGLSGRWGGEEFMVLVPESFDKARILAGQILHDFAAMDFATSGKHTVSIGAAQALPSETLDLLCQRVDKALYAAKKQGKNCIVVA